jgi:hypothetical protein
MTWLEFERVALALSVPLLLSTQLWPAGLVLTLVGSVWPASSPLWALAGALGVWRLVLGAAPPDIDPMRISPLAPPRAVLAILWVIWVAMMFVAPEILTWITT